MIDRLEQLSRFLQSVISFDMFESTFLCEWDLSHFYGERFEKG